MSRGTYQVAPSDDLESGGTWLTHCVEVEEWDHEDAVNSAVKIFVSEHDGWEWVKEGTHFSARKKGEEVAEEFEISIDYDQVYYANRID
jgi:hypothetical protein